MNIFELRGFYAITSQAICADEDLLLRSASAALRGGARLIQYRDKCNDAAIRERYARLLLACCANSAARLIINDDAQLAARIGAQGVHLGKEDAPLSEARELLGSHAIIGVTCSNSLERARAAHAAGADYIALGRFFPSNTKPDAPQVPLELIGQVRALFPRLPICVIGGITPGNAAPLIARGASLVAAVEGVFGVRDVELAARQYAACFD